MAYQPTWKERLEDVRPYFGPALATLIAVGVLGWVTWRQLGADQPELRPAKGGSLDVRKSAAARDVDALEQTYERALASETAGRDAEALLNRVIQKQRDAMKLEPEPTAAQAERLARLEAARGTLRARAAVARSQVLEAEAKSDLENGRGEAAVEKLRTALRLQREADAGATAPGLQDLPREARLATALEDAQAEPLQIEVELARTLAVAAAAREQWAEALRGFTTARVAQAQLNQRFPASRHADAAALERFDAEIASLNAASLSAASAAKEREGDVAAAGEGKTREAGAAFEAAADLQREINEKYPRSRFASATRINELAVRRDTALSAASLARAAELEREATLQLRARQAGPAAEKIVEAATLMERVASLLPRSRSLNDGLRQRLTYLAARRNDLAWVQEAIHPRLARVPMAGGAQLLATEVTQEVYARVMSTNPSRNSGRALPVDSVSWHEAREFCMRLSWILGAKVRLPTEAEFRAAFGRDTTKGAEEIAAGAWSAENAGGRSHEAGKSPPMATGCFDLAGNLAEWLEAAGEAGETAPVAGGSYLDPVEALRRVPVTTMEKRERARHIGFRIAIEWPAP